MKHKKIVAIDIETEESKFLRSVECLQEWDDVLRRNSTSRQPDMLEAAERGGKLLEKRSVKLNSDTGPILPEQVVRIRLRDSISGGDVDAKTGQVVDVCKMPRYRSLLARMR